MWSAAGLFLFIKGSHDFIAVQDQKHFHRGMAVDEESPNVRSARLRAGIAVAK